MTVSSMSQQSKLNPPGRRSVRMHVRICAIVATLVLLAGCSSLSPKPSTALSRAASCASKYSTPASPTWNNAQVTEIPWNGSIPIKNLAANDGGIHFARPGDCHFSITPDQAIALAPGNCVDCGSGTYAAILRPATAVYIQPVDVTFSWGGTDVRLPSAYFVVFVGPLAFPPAGGPGPPSKSIAAGFIVNGESPHQSYAMFAVGQ